MKFLLVLSCLVLYVALTTAQSCRGLPRRQDCLNGKDEGVRHLPHCTSDPNNEMWWYSRVTNECLKMRYHGCGGNNNRYCTKLDCERRCP
ncbi:kunitz-type serine protease inhibitor tigerin-3-like [Drosophila ficusphila]|uniref:kunitz-type serine protease inhibitor tigerin-3-like n=1 Tax=Drosophila ficusphila TaxID=30025 RepID=UPI0007E5C322|nr:kunitz-type serine protease inhibitor tigerin-3-like [Drosophila ficusphila]